MALHGGHCGACTSYASLNRSIAVSALTPICIDKLCGRMNPEVARKTHRSDCRHSPLRSTTLIPFAANREFPSRLCSTHKTTRMASLVFCWQNTTRYVSPSEVRRPFAAAGRSPTVSPSGKLDRWTRGESLDLMRADARCRLLPEVRVWRFRWFICRGRSSNFTKNRDDTLIRVFVSLES